MASSKRDEPFVRIVSLRQFVGMFARGGDREATAAALVELSRVAHEGGLTDEARRRARQAHVLLEGEDPSEANTRSLLRLAAACLQAGDLETADDAAQLACMRAPQLDEAVRDELAGIAALLAGIARASRGDGDAARRHLHDARERLVASAHPEGAALALTQLGIVDADAEQWEAAAVCFRFAREFYRSTGDHGAAADVGALAARTLAAAKLVDSDSWYREAAADAQRTGDQLLAADLLGDLVDQLVEDGDADAAAKAASEALQHIRGGFLAALQSRDAGVLETAVELLVSGLFHRRFGKPGWQVLEKFRDELTRWGFHSLASMAVEARKLLAETH